MADTFNLWSLWTINLLNMQLRISLLKTMEAQKIAPWQYIKI